MEQNQNNGLISKERVRIEMKAMARYYLQMARNADNDHNKATFYAMATAYKNALEDIETTPCVDSKAERHAYWKKCRAGCLEYWECSACEGDPYSYIPSGDYCKDCGARMHSKDEFDQIPVGYIRRSYTVHCSGVIN